MPYQMLGLARLISGIASRAKLTSMSLEVNVNNWTPRKQAPVSIRSLTWRLGWQMDPRPSRLQPCCFHWPRADHRADPALPLLCGVAFRANLVGPYQELLSRTPEADIQ